MASKDDGDDAHTDKPYEVGYGKPPKHTRFTKGHRGHRAGRRKGARNLKTDVHRTLSTVVKVTSGGRPRKISTQEGALMVLRDRALKGDARALERLLKFAAQYNSDDIEQQAARPLDEDDRAILDAYKSEILGGFDE